MHSTLLNCVDSSIKLSCSSNEDSKTEIHVAQFKQEEFHENEDDIQQA